jgi:hypothetical protein
MRGQPGFFDVDERLKRLSGLGDHLEAFAAAVDFEMFRGDLVPALGYSDGAQGEGPKVCERILSIFPLLRSRRSLDRNLPARLTSTSTVSLYLLIRVVR